MLGLTSVSDDGVRLPDELVSSYRSDDAEDDEELLLLLLLLLLLPPTRPRCGGDADCASGLVA